MRYLKSLEKGTNAGHDDDEKAKAEYAIYTEQLLKLKPRLTPKAWKYFWEGFGPTGIHDARLIALTIGDGLGRVPNPFGRNPVRIRAEFVNQNQRHQLVFEYKQIRRFGVEFDATLGQTLYQLAGGLKIHDADFYLNANELHDVRGDELIGVDDQYLRHEFVFASGARIYVESAKLSFCRKRIPGRKSVAGNR